MPARYEWQFPFLLLAVRRCQPMWLNMGVPSQFVDSPRGVVDASRAFVLEVHNLAQHGITKAIERDIGVALDRLSMSLAGDYDRSVVGDVFEWGERYFVRNFATWNMWSLLLTSLAQNIAPSLATTLRPVSHDWLINALQRLYGPAASAEVRDAVRAAYAIPLSPLDGELLIIDAASRNQADEELFDAVLHAEVITWRHRAYMFWSEARDWLSADEIRSFTEAARGRAIDLQTNPDRVVDPVAAEGAS